MKKTISHFLDKPSLSDVVSKIESYPEVFAVTQKFRNLSLGDSSSSSSNISNLTSTASILERFKIQSNPSSFTKKMMDMTKAPFVDVHKNVSNLTDSASNCLMSIGFRFLPGQTKSLIQELKVPDTLDGLRNLRDGLGLSLTKSNIGSKALLKLKGFSDLSADTTSMLTSRVLVEAITWHAGYYGRFLVLVQLGLGCTVWYGFAPGDGMNPPIEGLSPLFDHIDNYDSFFLSPDVHVQPGFNKISLVEGDEDVSKPLSKAFLEDKPFMDISIPNISTSVVMGVSLGLAVAILCTFGISPSCGESII